MHLKSGITKLILVTCLLLFPFLASAQFWKPSPFNPEVHKRFLESETLQVRKFTYDFAEHGGAIGSIPLGVRLPEKAGIIRSYLRITTQLTDDGTGTVAIQCEDANNIKTATDMTSSSAAAFIEGQSTGAASAFIQNIAAACEITAVIGGATVTAGKLSGWVHYILHD